MSQVGGSLPAAVARAYAILGLRPGCSERALKTQYKRLVKTWHPDRFASDPVGQADATTRVRQIIQAYGTIDAYRAIAPSQRLSAATAADVTPDVNVFHGAPASRDVPHWSAGRPLTAEEKETIARAIGYRRPFLTLTSYLTWIVPFALGCFALIATRAGGEFEVTTGNMVAGLLLLSFSAGVLVRRAWLSREGRGAR